MDAQHPSHSAHPRGPWTMPLPEEDALGPWLGQSHRDKAIACVCRFLPAWGMQNVGGGFERVLPQGKTPTPAVSPLTRQEVKNGERREAKDVGLTVVVDARKQPPSPILFSALRSVQVHQAPCAIDMPGVSLSGRECCHPLGVPQSLPCACSPCDPQRSLLSSAITQQASPRALQHLAT